MGGVPKYGYGISGNMTGRTVSGTSYTLTYDAENRLTGVSGGATASFVYDGDGRRVKTTVNGVTSAALQSGGNHVQSSRTLTT